MSFIDNYRISVSVVFTTMKLTQAHLTEAHTQVDSVCKPICEHTCEREKNAGGFNQIDEWVFVFFYCAHKVCLPEVEEGGGGFFWIMYRCLGCVFTTEWIMDGPITGNLTGTHLSFSHLPLCVCVQWRCAEGGIKEGSLSSWHSHLLN